MKNYVSSGDYLTFTAPSGGVKAGNPYRKGSLVHIATTDAVEDEEYVGITKGVFTGLAKNTGSAWTLGESIYLEATGLELTDTATANYFGKALEAQTSASAVSGLVLLNGTAGNEAT